MKNKTALLFLSVLFLINIPLKAQEKQTVQELDIQPIEEYLLYLPQDYKETDYKTWPLLLFLHGSGERGDSIVLVQKHGPPKLVAAGEDFPFIIASPQCPSGRRWSVDDLNLLLNDLVEKYKVDEDRIYLTGLSMGGFGTWDLATQYPERFAAIAPICGGGNPALACRLKEVPVWIFHGEKDGVVPPFRSKEMAEALKACDGDVKLTLYPEAYHDSWTATYENPELYSWFLSHKKANKWASEFAAFDKQDSMTTKREDIILFTGSSSIRMWKDIQKDLKNEDILNRGFGGSTYIDLLKNIKRVVFRYSPEKIFIYSGDNDIAGGKSAEETFAVFRSVFRTIRDRLPGTEIYIIGAKPSPSRQHLIPEIKKFNKRTQEFLAHQENAGFIDIFTPMVDDDGQPKQKLFLDDDLHMNQKGYAIWTKAIKPYLK